MAAENDVSKTPLLRFLIKEKIRPFNVQLVQEFNEDDPLGRI